MKEIPNIISDKDYLYLCDLFELNFCISKEVYNYSLILEGDEYKPFLETISSMHKQLCLKIINILEDSINE